MQKVRILLLLEAREQPQSVCMASRWMFGKVQPQRVQNGLYECIVDINLLYM